MNPFQAPKAEVLDAEGGRVRLQEIGMKELKKLRNHSNTIRSMGSLWLLGILFSFVIVALSSSSLASRATYLGVSLLFVIPVYASWARPSWGRAIGIIFCSLGLLAFPIGTVLGAVGLFSFIKGESLFGPGRYTHSEIMRAFKDR